MPRGRRGVRCGVGVLTTLFLLAAAASLFGSGRTPLGDLLDDYPTASSS